MSSNSDPTTQTNPYTPSENQPSSDSAQASTSGQTQASTSDRTQTASNPRLQLGMFSKLVFGVDALICLANIISFGWMVYMLHIVKNANYDAFWAFVNTGIIVTGFVGFLGMLGNVLLLAGSPNGLRFVWYRIAVGFATVCWLLGMMFMLLPGSSLLSELNMPTVLNFLPGSMGYGLWVGLYTFCIVQVIRKHKSQK